MIIRIIDNRRGIMRGSYRSHKRKKTSKITLKTHRKQKKQGKEDWQKLFRERFFV